MYVPASLTTVHRKQPHENEPSRWRIEPFCTIVKKKICIYIRLSQIITYMNAPRQSSFDRARLFATDCHALVGDFSSRSRSCQWSHIYKNIHILYINISVYIHISPRPNRPLSIHQPHSFSLCKLVLRVYLIVRIYILFVCFVLLSNLHDLVERFTFFRSRFRPSSDGLSDRETMIYTLCIL